MDKTISEVSQGISALIEDLLEIKENVSDEVLKHLDDMEQFLEYAIDAADKAEAAKAKAH
jgi:predicted RNA-binding protein with RPS1 domain